MNILHLLCVGRDSELRYIFGDKMDNMKLQILSRSPKRSSEIMSEIQGPTQHTKKWKKNEKLRELAYFDA